MRPLVPVNSGSNDGLIGTRGDVLRGVLEPTLSTQRARTWTKEGTREALGDYRKNFFFRDMELIIPSEIHMCCCVAFIPNGPGDWNKWISALCFQNKWRGGTSTDKKMLHDFPHLR